VVGAPFVFEAGRCGEVGNEAKSENGSRDVGFPLGTSERNGALTAATSRWPPFQPYSDDAAEKDVNSLQLRSPIKKLLFEARSSFKYRRLRFTREKPKPALLT
jgi:hypothetical protein